MRTAVLLAPLLGITATGLIGQSKHGHSNQTVLNGPVQGADISAIISQLKKAGATSIKGEFETTDQFRARKATIPESLMDQMVFVMPLGVDAGIQYDADNQILHFHIPAESRYIDGEFVTTLAVKRVITNLPPYIASNAFGLSKPITKAVMDEQGIAFTGLPLYGWSAPMDRETAKRVKPLLCFSVAGLISEAALLQTTVTHTPTMTEPTDTVINGQYVPVRLTYLILTDVSNGKAAVSIPVTSR